MNKKIILGVAIAIIAGTMIFFGMKNTTVVDAIYPASEESGWIGEKIIGDPENAKLTIYEYADFGCSHCAEWNETINELMEKYDGEISLVFRSYDLGFQNGPAAARAATAAGLQGYFKEYKDLLFRSQADWFYAEEELDDKFTDYFIRASDGKGNVDTFKKDMESDNVTKRLEFENKMGEKVGLKGTPLFRINNKKVPLGDLTETIEKIVSAE